MKHANMGFGKGFTLAELLAVVIILSILTAIGAGTYKKAIERSRFNDALNIATTIQEAVDRYTYENNGATTTNKKQLDIAFENMQECSTPADNCIQTNYFVVTINGSSTVAQRRTGLYQARVYSEVVDNNTRKEPTCAGYLEEGKNFCVSVGYGGGCSQSGDWHVCEKTF